jgi:hypothetical protein
LFAPVALPAVTLVTRSGISSVAQINPADQRSSPADTLARSSVDADIANNSS